MINLSINVLLTEVLDLNFGKCRPQNLCQLPIVNKNYKLLNKLLFMLLQYFKKKSVHLECFLAGVDKITKLENRGYLILATQIKPNRTLVNRTSSTTLAFFRRFQDTY